MTTSCTTSANKHSDEGLAAATKHGDAQAFGELVLRHRQKVVAVAQRIFVIAGQGRLFPKLGCYEQLGSSVLRLIPLGSRAKIQVSESLYGMFETKNSCPVGRVFTHPVSSCHCHSVSDLQGSSAQFVHRDPIGSGTRERFSHFLFR
jgi:hypothetical protein